MDSAFFVLLLEALSNEFQSILCLANFLRASFAYCFDELLTDFLVNFLAENLTLFINFVGAFLLNFAFHRNLASILADLVDLLDAHFLELLFAG